MADAVAYATETAAAGGDVGFQDRGHSLAQHKIGVPDDVLRKPGALTDAEFDTIKQHPVLGARIHRSLNSRFGICSSTLPCARPKMRA